MKKLLLFIICILGYGLSQAQTLAFPGAEGGGMYTTGGRGGAVYYVNTLTDNNSGTPSTKEGSLRWCLNQTGARTILFKVSGTIRLNSKLKISNGDVTIAGQSAPGDGICVADYPVEIAANNVIIRYMRFRMGDEKISVGEADGADALGGRFCKNVLIDHCSISWCTDECSSFYINEDFTMQWCIITESLRLSKHDKGPHGYGGIWGGTNATFHHNLLAHHDSRNPRLGPNPDAQPYVETVDMRNNVIYNWVGNSCYAGEGMNVNIVNNYYKPGPGSPTGTSKRGRIFSPDKKTDDPSKPLYDKWGRYFIEGNVVDGTDSYAVNATNDNWTHGVYNQFSSGYGTVSEEDKVAMKMDTPFEVGTIITQTAQVAYEKVLSYAGASFKRDSHDERIVKETRTGTAEFQGKSIYNGYGSNYPGSDVDWKSVGYPKQGIIDSQSDLKPAGADSDWSAWPTLASGTAITDSNRDGIPDGWLEANYPDKTATDTNAEGYTYLEVYLNGLVEEITNGQHEVAAEEEKLLVDETFQTWEEKNYSTGGEVEKETNFSKEKFTYKLFGIRAYPNGTDTKFNTGATSVGYLRAEKNIDSYIEISPLASITKVSFVHAATGSNRGYKLWKKVSDGEWELIHSAVANPAGGVRINIDINERNVALKFTNIDIANNAFLTDLQIWGMHASSSPQVTLETGVNIEGAGAVSRSIEGDKFDQDTEITLTATPNFGYKFVKWVDASNNELSTDASYKFNIASNMKITAIFEAVQTYTFKVNIEGSKWGKVKLTPEPTDGKYEVGTIVKLDIVPNPVTTFNYWEDSSSDATRNVQVNADTEVTATFDEVSFIVGWNFEAQEPKTGRAGDYYSETTNTGTISMYKPDGSSVNWLANTGSFTPSYPCVRLWTSEADFLTERRYFQASFSTVGYKNINVKSMVSGNYQVYTVQKMQYSLDGITFTDLASVDITSVHNSGWLDCDAILPTEAENQNKVYIRWIADDTSPIKGTGNDGTALTNIYVFAEKEIVPDNDPPVFISSVPAEGATNASINGTITLTFDEKLKAGTGDITLNGQVLIPSFGAKTVTFKYSKLTYNTSYTLTIPAGALQDMSGNVFAGKVINFTTMQRQQPFEKAFDFIVAQDGSGDGLTVQEAINAAPTDGTQFLVFIKKGKYEERPSLPNTKKNISFIGQGIDDVVISAAVYSGMESGISTSNCQTFEVLGDNIYMENLTIENTAGRDIGQAVALKDYGKYNTYKNVRLLGHQDTHLTGSSSKQYYRDCDIRGTVDFIFGGGDIFFDNTLLYVLARDNGNVIVAPNTEASTQYGYVFRDCTIDGDVATQHNKYSLGRPWQKAPRAVYINTTMKILPTAAGWSNMGVIPALFAEYNSMDGDGSPIDLSNRKDEFTQSDDNGGQTVGGLQTVLSDAEAAEYVIGNVLSNTVNWDPLLVIENTDAPVITSDVNDIKWNKVDYAISYLVLHNDNIVASTKELSYKAKESGKIKVIAVAEFGALSNESNELDFVYTVIDEEAPLLSSSSPADNATNVSVDGTITLTFNEDVKVGTGDITLNSTVLTPSVSGAVVTLAYSGLSYETLQTLTIPAGVIQDLAGNNYAGTTIIFTTEVEPDTQAPALVSSLPANGDQDVDVNGTVTLTFDEDIKMGTGSIKLNSTTITKVTINGAVATFTYSGLAYEAAQTLTIESGAFIDLSGNPFAGAVISFTTIDEPERIPPTLISSTLNDGDKDQELEGVVVLKFSEPVKAGGAKIKLNGVYLTPVVDGETVILGYAGLYYEYTYNLEIPGGAIVDMVGNAYAGTTISFTTKPDPRFDDVAMEQNNGYLTVNNIPSGSDVYVHNLRGKQVFSATNVYGSVSMQMPQVAIMQIKTKKGSKKYKILRSGK